MHELFKIVSTFLKSGPSGESLIRQLDNTSMDRVKYVTSSFCVRVEDVPRALTCVIKMATTGVQLASISDIRHGKGVFMQVDGDELNILSYRVEQRPINYFASWIYSQECETTVVHYRATAKDYNLLQSELARLSEINMELGITDEPQYTDKIYITSALSDFLNVDADVKISRADVYRAIDTYIRNENVHGEWEDMVGDGDSVPVDLDNIVLDEDLQNLLNTEHNMRFSEICKYLEHHFFDIN